MADPLLELLLTNEDSSTIGDISKPPPFLEKYLSRILSLKPSDLTSLEPQSLAQSSHTNLLSLQGLSSRSHRSTIASTDQLSTLRESIPVLTQTTQQLQDTIPSLDSSAASFASTYSRSRLAAGNDEPGSAAIINEVNQRKESMLLARQASTLQDILELPSLLSTAIASAASGPAGSANYTQALDLYAHIKRLQILYPESKLVASVQLKAEEAMKDMTVSLLGSLRGQNIRLTAAIRTIGWLKRIVPEIGTSSVCVPGKTGKEGQGHSLGSTSTILHQEDSAEGSFGALFLVARLSTFLSMTEDALAPLRDLADQETEKRLQCGNVNVRMEPMRRPSAHGSSTYGIQGQQTERYLKRYIEIFREQSFATVQMYRNIFLQSSPNVGDVTGGHHKDEDDLLKVPTALASFPMHLSSLLMETLQIYLPNVTDEAARESLLIQVLYAANSMGRLGADLSMLISLLDLPSDRGATTTGDIAETGEGEKEATMAAAPAEPEWYRAIKKHRIQAARLDALASGQDNAARRASQDVAVR